MSKYLCLLALSLFSCGAIAQADNQQGPAVSSTQIDVLAVYEDVVAQGYHSAQVYQKLASGRYLEKNYPEAKKWYIKLFALNEKPEAIEYLRFAETLEALKEFDLAQTYKAQYEILKEKE
jgi:hypothetical protein